MFLKPGFFSKQFSSADCASAAMHQTTGLKSRSKSSPVRAQPRRGRTSNPYFTDCLV